MPQFDVTSFPSQIFWLVVTFAILYLVFSTLVLPRIGDVLQKRQEQIASDLDRAAALKREAEELVAGYEAALAEARAKAHAVYKETEDAIAASSAKQQQEAGAAIAARIAEAEKRIGAARTQALENIRSVAVDVAQAAAAKVAGMSPDTGRLTGEIDRILQERRA